MKLARSLDRLGTESAFTVLAEAKKLEAQGKPMIHLGLGQPGVERALELYRSELVRDMKLMGCTKISDLNRNNLRFRK